MTVIAHRVDGSGPPLLLLNGIAMSTASWGPVAEALAENFQVIRCDLRGQLLSPGPAHPDPADHANDIVALLDHLEIEVVGVVGTSFGGVVAAMLAAHFPDRVRTLISIASTYSFDASMAAELERWRRACEEVLEGASAVVLAEVLEAVAYAAGYLESHRKEREAARAAMGGLPSVWFSDLITLLDSASNFDHAEDFRQIECPTLIVAAELDGLIPRKDCKALAEIIPGADFKVIHGGGHAVVVEQPETVVDLIRSFLRSALPSFSGKNSGSNLSGV